MKKQNYAFIDSQNLNLGTKLYGWKLDYGKFRLFLRNKYNVSRAFLFIGFVEGNANLYRDLQEKGYILIFKHVMEIRNGKQITYKGNVDAELVLHTMIEKDNCEKVIIVSGDGDFFCLVEYLSNKNKLLKIIVPNRKFSSLLKRYAKFIHQLELSKEKLSK